MEGHVFMSDELLGRVRESPASLGDETIVITSDCGAHAFVGGYRDFFLSPRLIKVVGSLTKDFPVWLCEHLGQRVTMDLVLRSTKITRNVLLTETSVSFDDNSWIVCGEILIDGVSP